MQRLAVPFTCCIVWFMAAWAIEHYWLASACGACAHVLGFDLTLNAQDLLRIATGRVSAVVLVGVPLLLYLAVLIPYGHPLSRSHWADAMQRWCRPFFWLAMVILCVWIGELAVAAVARLLPGGFRTYAEGYRLGLSATAPGMREIGASGHLGACLGLLMGVYLFLSRGLARHA